MNVTHAFGGAFITLPGEDIPVLIEFLQRAARSHIEDATYPGSLEPSYRQEQMDLSARAEQLIRELNTPTP